jgi:hypothetical protein
VHKTLPLLVLILISASSVWAGPGLDIRPQIDSLPNPTSTWNTDALNELIPDLSDLRCESRCSGSSACGQYRGMDACLEEGAAQGCFWSCE